MSAMHSSEMVGPVPVGRQLQLHTHERGDDIALVDLHAGRVEGRSWRELDQRVERAAAALIQSGLRAHQVVLLLLDSGADAYEIELAVRMIGAVPLYLGDGVTGPQLASRLVGVDMPLVVVDSEDRLARLDGCDVSNAKLLVMDGDAESARFQALGADALSRRPALVRTAEPKQEHVAVVLHSEGAGVVVSQLGEPQPPGAVERVLLHGVGSNPLVSAARDRHLASGGCLAWTSEPTALPELLRALAPTAAVLDARGVQGLEHLLHSATVNGRPWSPDPAAVLTAVVHSSHPATSSRSARRRARSVADLRPCLGGQVSSIVAEVAPTETLVAVVGALGIALTTPPRPRLMVGHLPQSVAPTGDPAKLPRRVRAEPDGAFRIEAQGPTSPPVVLEEDATDPPGSDNPSPTERDEEMTNPDKYMAALENIESSISGFIGASVVDIESGMPLATKSARADFDLDVASAYNSELVKAKLNTMRLLNITSGLEDMLLTLGDQLHLIKLVGEGQFVYVAAERAATNLALLRSAVNRETAAL